MKQIKVVNQVDNKVLSPSVAIIPQIGSIVNFEEKDNYFLVKDLLYVYYDNGDYGCTIYVVPIDSTRISRCCH